MDRDILLELFKKVTLYDLSECTFEYIDEEGEMCINAKDKNNRVVDSIIYDGNIFHIMVQGEGFQPIKPMVDVFRQLIPLLDQRDYENATSEAMFCVSCQALEEHDCFCEDDIDEPDCSVCCGANGTHFVDCPYNNNPFDNLLRDGYD